MVGGICGLCGHILHVSGCNVNNFGYSGYLCPKCLLVGQLGSHSFVCIGISLLYVYARNPFSPSISLIALPPHPHAQAHMCKLYSSFYFFFLFFYMYLHIVEIFYV